MLAHDAYDLVFTLLNHEGGAEAAGRAAAASAVAGHPQVTDALALPEERFSRCLPPNEYRPLFQDRTYVDVISRRFVPDTRRANSIEGHVHLTESRNGPILDPSR